MGDDKAAEVLGFYSGEASSLTCFPLRFIFFFDKTLGDGRVSAMVTVAEKSCPHGPEWPLKPCGRHM